MAGNKNSGRKAEKPFKDALRMELAAAGEDQKALRKVAKVLIKKAQDGDMQAIKELGDRIDGKVAQQVNHADNTGEGPAQFVYRTVYESKPD